MAEINKSNNEKNQLEAKLRQLQELKFTGLLAGGIVHSFNNTIGVIHGYADLALRATSPSDRIYAYLKQILEEADLAKNSAEKLRVFTKQKKPDFKLINIHSTVEQAIKIFEGSGSFSPTPHPEERPPKSNNFGPASPKASAEAGEISPLAENDEGSQRSFDPIGSQNDHSGTTVNNIPTGQTFKELLAAPIDIQQDIDTMCGAVLADTDQIQQVVINLCSNAYDAIRENGGTVKITLKEVDVGAFFAEEYEGLNEGRYAKLTVNDTGHGMDPNILRQIYEPFFTTKKISEHAGLGLSVVHEIISGHKGKIVAESSPGEGTTFDIYLPLENK